jgi:hypothetical protein
LLFANKFTSFLVNNIPNIEKFNSESILIYGNPGAISTLEAHILAVLSYRIISELARVLSSFHSHLATNQ